MAFGVKREELDKWKQNVKLGNVAFLTHYWLDSRFPNCNTVTKVGCSNIERLTEWGSQYGLQSDWIHMDPNYPHFDLFGDTQVIILTKEKQWDQINRFKLKKSTST